MWIRTVNGMVWIEIEFTQQGFIVFKIKNNEVLTNNKELLDAKIKEIFKLKL